MKYELKFKDKDEVAKQYHNLAENYDFARSRDFEGIQVDKLQINLIRNLLKKNDSKKILEAGCGTGRILLPLANDFDCYGIDPAKNMLKIICEKAKQKELNVNVQEGDIENLPFEDNFFDAVFTVHVLMHLPSHKQAVQEMYRVTKQGGLIIMDFPNYNSLWTKLSLLLFPEKKRTRLLTKKTLEADFKEYNYTITGLFSWARTFYKIPLLRHLTVFLETYVKLPVSFRGAYFVIIKK